MNSAFLATDTSPNPAEVRTCVMCPALCCFETFERFLLASERFMRTSKSRECAGSAHDDRVAEDSPPFDPALTDSGSSL